MKKPSEMLAEHLAGLSMDVRVFCQARVLGFMQADGSFAQAWAGKNVISGQYEYIFPDGLFSGAAWVVENGTEIREITTGYIAMTTLQVYLVFDLSKNFNDCGDFAEFFTKKIVKSCQGNMKLMSLRPIGQELSRIYGHGMSQAIPNEAVLMEIQCFQVLSQCGNAPKKLILDCD